MPTVFVVDDEPIVRNLIRVALAGKGYAVLDAIGVSDAVALCESLGEQKIDLLIVDHGLYPGNGRTVAEELVKICPDVKVLVISGWSFQKVHEDGGFVPGSSFLQKPFTAQTLVATVRSLLFPTTH